MSANLDMNSNHILNLPAPTSSLEPVRLLDLQEAQGLAAAFPTQTGNAGKFLKTDGSTVSWDTPDAGDFAAEDISFTPAGDVVADNVQDAIEELDSEKMPKTGGAFSGDISVSDGTDGVVSVGPSTGALYGNATTTKVIANSNLEFVTDGSTRLTIDASGNLIGTVLTPTQNAHLVTKKHLDDRFDYLHSLILGRAIEGTDFKWESMWTGSTSSLALYSNFGIGLFKVTTSGGTYIVVTEGVSSSVNLSSVSHNLVVAADTITGVTSTSVYKLYKW